VSPGRSTLTAIMLSVSEIFRVKERVADYSFSPGDRPSAPGRLQRRRTRLRTLPFRHFVKIAQTSSPDWRYSPQGTTSACSPSVERLFGEFMRLTSSAKLILGAIPICAALAVWLGPAARSAASNHIDSPISTQDRGANITDHWAFLDPNDNSKIVLIMGTQGFIIPGEHFGMSIFDPNLRYRWMISNSGNAKPDINIDVTYAPGVGRLTAQTATIVLPTGERFTAPTTIAVQTPIANAPVITTDPASGVKFFAGVMDDPFFLDDTGANLFGASAMMHPGHPDKGLLGMRGGRDTYAGFNTLITALELPVSMLKGSGDKIGFEVATQRQAVQTAGNDGSIVGSGQWKTLDREGFPFINNALIPPPLKDRFGTSNPEADAQGVFKSAIEASLKAIGTDDAHAKMVIDAAVTHGDYLVLDVKIPNSGPGGGNNAAGGLLKNGGRRLQDIAPTLAFTLLNNGVLLTDHVLKNDVTFRNEFPFVADPHQPGAPGHEPSGFFQ
jgi:Domain of unknown function (DUF4331)